MKKRKEDEGGHEITIDPGGLYTEPDSSKPDENGGGCPAYEGPMVCPGLQDKEHEFMKSKITWFPQNGSYSRK